MTDKDLITSSTTGEPKQGSIEVQFALVLAKTIDAARKDSANLRQAIYDLARYKLQEQFTHSNVQEIKRAQSALETAIYEVEDFARSEPESTLLLERTDERNRLNVDATPALEATQPPPIAKTPIRSTSATALSNRRKIARTSIFLVSIAVIGAAAQQHQRIRTLFAIEKLGQQDAASKAIPLSQEASLPEPMPPTSNRLRPKQYGVYAISANELRELLLLPGRAPDIRVGISAAINTASKTVLPNGHPRFIVFRRDLSSSVSDRADVRIIAKVAREFTTEVAGKELDTRNETWVIRNIAFPFRSAPVAENPEMFELHSDEPNLELPPGRYALVIKGQAYDFTVQGKINDPRQCIERIVAVNGTFYSDCKNSDNQRQH